MAKETHEIWVNEDGSFDCESHSIKGEKCIEELRKLLDGLAVIEEFEKKKDFHDTRQKGIKKRTNSNQRVGSGNK